MEAVRYLPETNEWRKLPDVLTADENGPGAFVAVGIGSVDGSAVFLVGGGSHRGELLSVAADGAASWSPALEGSEATCVLNGKIVAVRTGRLEPNGNVVLPTPSANAPALNVFALDPSRHQWTLISSTPKPDVAPDAVQLVLCGGGAMSYLGIHGHIATAVLWLDATSMSWRPLPPIDFGNYPIALAVGAIGSQRVVWDGAAGHLFRVDAAVNRWNQTKINTTDLVALSQMGESLLVDPSYSVRPPDRQYIGIVEPTTLG